MGRGADTRSAINKAYNYAASHMENIDLVGDTVPHSVEMKYRAAKLIVKPAGPGTGIIASSAVRAVMEMAGVRNVLTKQLGSDNPVVNAYCAFKALREMRKKRVLERRSKSLKKKLKKPSKKNATRRRTQKKK